MEYSATITVEISYGELFDKISILEIKLVNVSNADQRANIERELTVLTEARDRSFKGGPDIREIEGQLHEINLRLWSIENDLRACERQKNFDRDFIERARLVYKINDERAALKRKINDLLGSKLVEEKIYRDL